MWFLLVQISLLLLLAAAFGAALAWWWLNRDVEDVTESHETMLAQSAGVSARLDGLKDLATRADLTSVGAHMAGSLASLNLPDMTPVNDRLERLEQTLAALHIPEPDLQPVMRGLHHIDAKLATPNPVFEALASRLGDIERAVTAARPAEVDLGPVHSALLTIQLELEDMRNAAPRLEPLSERISALTTGLSQTEARLQSAQATDIDALTTLVAEVAAGVGALRMPDLSPLQLSLTELQSAMAALDRKPVDLGPLNARLGSLEALIRALQSDVHGGRGLEPVERQIASVQEALQGMRDPDMTPVLNAVYSIDGRQDLIAVESRITAIEYSLAALHHMVRTRVEPSPARPEQTWPRAVPPARPQPAAVQPFAPPVREGSPEPVREPFREPLRDSADVDPVASLRRPGDRANLLVEPAFGPPDDLEQINGVGPILASLLRDIGVYYFWQVAEWTPDQAAWVDGLLQHFRGRIRRDDWVGHARLLSSMPNVARRPLTRQPRRTPI